MTRPLVGYKCCNGVVSEENSLLDIDENLENVFTTPVVF